MPPQSQKKKCHTTDEFLTVLFVIALSAKNVSRFFFPVFFFFSAHCQSRRGLRETQRMKVGKRVKGGAKEKNLTEKIQNAKKNTRKKSKRIAPLPENAKVQKAFVSFLFFFFFFPLDKQQNANVKKYFVRYKYSLKVKKQREKYVCIYMYFRESYTESKMQEKQMEIRENLDGKMDGRKTKKNK